MTKERKRILLVEQMALTRAIQLCEDVAARKDRLTRGAKECAALLQRVRDQRSEASGLRQAMGWARRGESKEE